MGVDKLEAHGSQVRRRHGGIAAPAVGPIANHNICVKGTVGCIVLEVDAIVERHRLHASTLNQRSHLINVINIVAVIASGQEVAKAHSTAGKLIVGILIRAHVEILATLARKIINVLLQQRLSKGGRSGIGNINGAARTAVRTSHTGQFFCCIQNGVHMTGRVDAGNHAHALLVGIANNFIHLTLGQLIGGKVIIISITCLNCSLNVIATVGFAIDRQLHIVQQEAQTIIAHCQLDIVEASAGCIINELLNAAGGVIFSAAVQEEDIHSIAVYHGLVHHRLRAGRRIGGVGSQCGNRQGAKYQHCREQDRKESGYFLFHGLLALLYFIVLYRAKKLHCFSILRGTSFSSSLHGNRCTSPDTIAP